MFCSVNRTFTFPLIPTFSLRWTWTFPVSLQFSVPYASVICFCLTDTLGQLWGVCVQFLLWTFSTVWVFWFSLRVNVCTQHVEHVTISLRQGAPLFIRQFELQVKHLFQKSWIFEECLCCNSNKLRFVKYYTQYWNLNEDKMIKAQRGINRIFWVKGLSLQLGIKSFYHSRQIIGWNRSNWEKNKK